MSNEDHLNEELEQQAAAWVWKLDRGLFGDEQDMFFDWLAENPQHSNALVRYRKTWKRLDNLSSWLPEHSDVPNPDLLAPTRQSQFIKYITFSLLTAAVVTLSLFVWKNDQPELPDFGAAAIVEQTENRNALEDGSIVKLKDDAKITVLYTEAERRIRLDRGEAFFIVTKNPLRPFVVEVQGIDVSALGTAFNVRLDSESFEVLVSEGVVSVEAQKYNYDERLIQENPVNPLLEANQRAIISLSKVVETPAIATLTKGEIHRVLAWQHGLVSFTSKPLSEIAYELNHFNETQMTVLDEELANTRFSGSFRSDNMKGFVRLLEAAFGATAQWDGDSEVLLSKTVD